MKRFFFLAVFFLCSISFISKANDAWRSVTEDPGYIHRTMKEVTDVIVHDIYSPPVASRIYAYVSIAGYEAAISSSKNYTSFAGQLHGFNSLPKPDASQQYSAGLSATHAMLLVAEALIISEDTIKNFHNQLLKEYKNSGIPQVVYDSSLAYGKQIATAILAWAGKDQYKETRALGKFAVLDDSITWKPTPPAYMQAIEPYWGRMRTFLLDSIKNFKPLPAIPFSTDTASAFYKEAKAVYDKGNNLTTEEKFIANFWDCNPFKMNVDGHVMYATKKISPGGHWINITALACKQTKADIAKSTQAYACVSITLADAFISCWDEKYRSIVIRPETYINNYIDQSWMPLLQTPPFPEYTSGHSVVSAASATILTKIFGDNFSYTDSTENEFGLQPRRFTSFNQAAEEAAVSRYYGGIHYDAAIVNGLTEGRKIGIFVLANINMNQ
jgi:hypothetical protein